MEVQIIEINVKLRLNNMLSYNGFKKSKYWSSSKLSTDDF